MKKSSEHPRFLARLCAVLAAGAGSLSAQSSASTGPGPTQEQSGDTGASNRVTITDTPLEQSVLPTVRPYTSAFGLDNNILDLPRNVAIIPRAQLDTVDIQDVRDSSKLTSSSYTTTNFGAPSNPSIRGQIADTLTNGLRTDITSNGNGLPIDYNAIESVSILKGPAPVIRGPSPYVGGFVNFVTKQPYFDRWQGFVGATVGEYSQNRWTGDVSGPLIPGEDARAVADQVKASEPFKIGNQINTGFDFRYQHIVGVDDFYHEPANAYDITGNPDLIRFPLSKVTSGFNASVPYGVGFATPGGNYGSAPAKGNIYNEAGFKPSLVKDTLFVDGAVFRQTRNTPQQTGVDQIVNVKGVELEANHQPNRHFLATAGYTFLSSYPYAANGLFEFGLGASIDGVVTSTIFNDYGGRLKIPWQYTLDASIFHTFKNVQVTLAVLDFTDQKNFAPPNLTYGNDSILADLPCA